MQPLPDHVPSRVVIEGIKPETDDGRFPAKRTVGDVVTVAADVHTGGHDLLAGAALRSRHVPPARGKSEKPGQASETRRR